MECVHCAIEKWTDKNNMAINALAAGDEVLSQSDEKSKSEIVFWQFDIPKNQRCTAEFNEQFIVIVPNFL